MATTKNEAMAREKKVEKLVEFLQSGGFGSAHVAVMDEKDWQLACDGAKAGQLLSSGHRKIASEATRAVVASRIRGLEEARANRTADPFANF